MPHKFIRNIAGYSQYLAEKEELKFKAKLNPCCEKTKQEIISMIEREIEKLKLHLEEVEIKEAWIYEELFKKTQQKIEALQDLLTEIKSD